MTKEVTSNVRKKAKVGGKIFLLVLLSLLMPTTAGIIIGVRGLTDTVAIFQVQFIAIAFGCVLTIIWASKSLFSFKSLGFKVFSVGKWLFGIVAIEAVAFLGGINDQLSAQAILWLCLFMIAVGFFEELIYRGLIMHYLKSTSSKMAIVVSSLLFGSGHLINVLGGAELKLTIAQIIFACLFGAVAAEIVLLTKSILPVMIWHTCHNVVAHLTQTVDTSSMGLGLVAVQCVLLLVMAISLWKKLFSTSEIQGTTV